MCPLARSPPAHSRRRAGPGVLSARASGRAPGGEGKGGRRWPWGARGGPGRAGAGLIKPAGGGRERRAAVRPAGPAAVRTEPEEQEEEKEREREEAPPASRVQPPHVRPAVPRHGAQGPGSPGVPVAGGDLGPMEPHVLGAALYWLLLPGSLLAGE